MTETLPRYDVVHVGAGWDVWVVLDRTKGDYAGAFNRDNWVAQFYDNSIGLAAAKAKAEELNNVKPWTIPNVSEQYSSRFSNS